VNPLPPKSFLDGDHPRNRVPIPRRNTGRLDVSGVRDMGFGRHQPKPFAARDHQARLTIAERGRPPECTTLLVIRRAAFFDVFPEIPALEKVSTVVAAPAAQARQNSCGSRAPAASPASSLMRTSRCQLKKWAQKACPRTCSGIRPSVSKRCTRPGSRNTRSAPTRFESIRLLLLAERRRVRQRTACQRLQTPED